MPHISIVSSEGKQLEDDGETRPKNLKLGICAQALLIVTFSASESAPPHRSIFNRVYARPNHTIMGKITKPAGEEKKSKDVAYYERYDSQGQNSIPSSLSDRYLKES